MIYPQPDQSRLGGIENDIRYYRHFWSRTTNMFRLKTCTRKLKKLKTCKLEKWSWHPFPCPSMPQASKGKRRDREKYVSATCSVAAERSLSSRHPPYYNLTQKHYGSLFTWMLNELFRPGAACCERAIDTQSSF